MNPPKPTYHKIELPLTTLHYAKCGNGPPLIMVPATISELNNWLGLLQFMAQKFTVYFFELPGHGKSEPFKQEYSSKLVAQTIEDFLDALNIEKSSLMGFSFGGILTMHTLKRLGNRIERVILLAPCVSHKAVWMPDVRMRITRISNKIFFGKNIQGFIIKLVNNKKIVDMIIYILIKFGHVESYKGGLRDKLLTLKPATLDVLIHQIEEITNSEPINDLEKTKVPCFLGMSVYDPLLKYETTKQMLVEKFENIHIQEFYFPYHQPPKPFTFEYLNKEYSNLLKLVETETR